VKQKKPPPAPVPKLWSVTERSRLERMLMLWGYSDWENISAAFHRRSIQDLQAASKQLIARCLKTPNLDSDLVADVKSLVELDLAKEGEESLGAGIDQVSDETPYPNATEKQVKRERGNFD
jgi:hypothetical protein